MRTTIDLEEDVLLAAKEIAATEGDNIAAHQVGLDGFWIHRTEVTNGLYAQCVAAGACQPPQPDPAAAPGP